MSAHIYFPAFERGNLPVTLSPSVLTGLLREELGFKGVIMTDCMEMHAISLRYGTVNAAVMAVEAGADLVLISHTFDLQVGAVEALLHAVRSGRISEDRIDQSVSRLLGLKAKRGLTADAGDHAAMVGTAAHREVARRLSEASVTLVKDAAGLLPLSGKPTLVLAMEPGVVSLVDESYEARATLGKAIAAQGLAVKERVIPLERIAELSGEILELVAPYDQIVIGTYNAHFYPEQIKLVQDILELGKQPVVIALRNPYDIQKFPDVPAYICLYESRPFALQSAAKLLMGKIRARGRLPVTISDSYPVGWGVLQS
jgi:beta-N-acetylhexosaminidase